MIRVTDKQYFMDGYLVDNLNTGIYNLKRDFDLIGVITGSGMVRIGKSAIAQQIGYYCAYELETPFDINNIVFNGEELISTAKKLPPNSVIIYDEARGELDTAKVMENVTKTLLDFFAECGYMNHAFILVLPDFFELPKRLAINRADFLINVFRTVEQTTDSKGRTVNRFERGHYQFYNRERKKRLYIEGKKALEDYGVGKHNFYGDFPNLFLIDKQLYDAKKRQHVLRDRKKQRVDDRVGIVLKALCTLVSQRQASKMLSKYGLNLTQPRINQLIVEHKTVSLENAPSDK